MISYILLRKQAANASPFDLSYRHEHQHRHKDLFILENRSGASNKYLNIFGPRLVQPYSSGRACFRRCACALCAMRGGAFTLPFRTQYDSIALKLKALFYSGGPRGGWKQIMVAQTRLPKPCNSSLSSSWRLVCSSSSSSCAPPPPPPVVVCKYSN